jgi:hypothetical protein
MNIQKIPSGEYFLMTKPQLLMFSNTLCERQIVNCADAYQSKIQSDSVEPDITVVGAIFDTEMISDEDMEDVANFFSLQITII